MIHKATYSIRADLAILHTIVDYSLLTPGGIDAAINDGQGHVHALGAILAG